MNKPKWKDAPEWANYLAMDEDRDWYWHSTEPVQGEQVWICTGGSIERADTTPAIDWTQALEQRP